MNACTYEYGVANSDYPVQHSHFFFDAFEAGIPYADLPT